MSDRTRFILKVRSLLRKTKLTLIMTHNHAEAVCTSGYVGEFSFGRLLREGKLPQIRFDSLQLIETAKQSKAGCERLSQALPYLKSEYGTQYRTPEGKYRIKLDWRNIPAEAILDKVYGLDAVISFRGWTIGIDVTTDPEALIQKRHKLNWLAHLWREIGIDRVAVIHLFIPKQRTIQPKKASSDLISELRQVIKNQKQIFALTL